MITATNVASATKTTKYQYSAVSSYPFNQPTVSPSPDHLVVEKHVITSHEQPPADGSVRLFDRNLYECNDDEDVQLFGNTFGFIFQSFRLFPSLKVLDNVALGLDIKGDTESEKKQPLVRRCWTISPRKTTTLLNYPVAKNSVWPLLVPLPAIQK